LELVTSDLQSKTHRVVRNLMPCFSLQITYRNTLHLLLALCSLLKLSIISCAGCTPLRVLPQTLRLL
jgi:hypothetical protein